MSNMTVAERIKRKIKLLSREEKAILDIVEAYPGTTGSEVRNILALEYAIDMQLKSVNNVLDMLHESEIIHRNIHNYHYHWSYDKEALNG